MEELSKRAETLLRELLINENQLFEYLKDKFEKVERLEKDDSKLRFTLSELIEKGYFNCFWADNIPYSPSLSHLADEYFEAESSKELDFNKDIMITILREVANEFNIANVFFWDVPSCGRSQIGWEQIDELEWRVKVEAHDFINISRASKQIENKLRLYNYISTDSERIEKGTRKVIVQNYKHKSIASLDKTDKIDDDSIIESLIESCLRLQAYKLIKSASEDDISTYIRDMLTSKGIQVLDQTRRGKSATGKQAGELDLLIVDDKNRPVLIIEAFKLSSLERKNIDLHIDKVFGYDTNGLGTNIILIYAYATDFKKLCKQYVDYLKEIKLSYSFDRVADTSNNRYSEIKIVESEYIRSGMERKLVHIIVNLSD